MKNLQEALKFATPKKNQQAKHEDATLGKVEESVIKAQIIL